MAKEQPQPFPHLIFPNTAHFLPSITTAADTQLLHPLRLSLNMPRHRRPPQVPTAAASPCSSPCYYCWYLLEPFPKSTDSFSFLHQYNVLQLKKIKRFFAMIAVHCNVWVSLGVEEGTIVHRKLLLHRGNEQKSLIIDLLVMTCEGCQLALVF